MPVRQRRGKSSETEDEVESTEESRLAYKSSSKSAKRCLVTC